MRRTLAIAILLLGWCTAAGATLPATCIAPAKPGGGFDLTCKLLRDMLQLPAPQPTAQVEVKYLPGGIGALAFDRAVTQRWGDPRTFIAFSSGSLANLAQGKFGPHEPRDVRWLATLGTEYGVVAVRKGSRIQSLKALRELLAANPAGAVFGAGGTVGSQDWIKAALLVKAAGSDHRTMRFVAFEGGGQALAALEGGHVDVFCGDMLETADALAKGDIRLLAVLAPHRLGGRLAQVPTARELGVDVVWPTVRGVYMGPAVPAKDFEEWRLAVQRVMQRPGFRELLAAYGLEPHGLTGPELDAFVGREVEAYKRLAGGLGLRVR